MAAVITLTTDFGYDDAYVASMKGVILSINPEAIIVDISHTVMPHDIVQASFVLSIAHRYFPKGTIHLAIVDPGVGSQRKAVILKTPSAYFLAPDNGILSYILHEFGLFVLSGDSSTLKEVRLGAGLEAIAITNPEFWLQPVSCTFHGRDIFSPVGANLSLGVSASRFGESLDRLWAFFIPQPYSDGEGRLVGRILHVDNFGNLITNIKSSDMPRGEISVEVGGQRIDGISRFYADRRGLMAVVGGSDYLEISVQNGNAAALLKTKLGDIVTLRVA